MYGNSSSDGNIGTKAFSANAPCPISRRPAPLDGFASPTEYDGKLYWCIYFLNSVSKSIPSNDCTSAFVPSVAIVNTCVCPLENSPLPCTLGIKSTSAVNLRTSSIALPSGLICSFKMIDLTHFFCKSWIAVAMSNLCSSSAFSPNISIAIFLIFSETLSTFSFLVILSVSFTAFVISSVNSLHTLSKYSEFTENDLYSNFGFPISSLIVWMNSHIFLISTCAAFIASSIISFEILSAPASIIVIFSFVPATVAFILLFALCSQFGLIMIWLSTYPTATAADGPPHGMSDIANAADVPICAHTSGLFS